MVEPKVSLLGFLLTTIKFVGSAAVGLLLGGSEVLLDVRSSVGFRVGQLIGAFAVVGD